MREAITEFFVSPADSLRKALQVINSTGAGIALLVDDAGRLKRTVTDGDIRRLLIAGRELDSTLASLPDGTPTVVAQAISSAEALEIMNRLHVDHLPRLDDQGKPVGLFVRREIDEQIFLSAPHLGNEEQKFVEQAFTTNWIAPLGPNVDAFERELAEYAAIGHAAATSSGTAALHLALRLLDIAPGDTVFCSDFTFVASANPILYEGAVPVFIDSDLSTWNISPAALARALADAEREGRLPRAVIVVSIYGQSADMDPIVALCARYGVPLIEDAAESLGATYKGRHSGTMGRIGVYSFNGNKIITTSGGGMLVSDDAELVEKARFLSTQARDPAPYYQHSQVGFNYRMSNVLAGIGRGQIRVIEDRVRRRREIFDTYREQLSDLPGISWMPEASYGRSTRWLSAFLFDPRQCAVGPTDLIAALAARRIEARRLWKPMHTQPLFAGARHYAVADRSVADDLFAGGVCLPSGSNMSEGQVRRVVEAIRDAVLGRPVRAAA